MFIPANFGECENSQVRFSLLEQNDITTTVHHYNILDLNLQNSENSSVMIYSIYIYISLAYLEFASGRIESKYNAEKEVENRRDETISLQYPNEHGVASEENYDEIFEEELDLVCASIEGYCGFKREDLDKRVTWPADGATRESWPWERASGTVETKLNRKAAMEALDSGEFWNLLEIEIKAIDKNPGMRRERGRDEPVLEGSAADKFENAKGPLLAAGDNRSHVVQHLIAHKVERALLSDPRFGHPRNEGDAYKHLSEFFIYFVC